MNENRETDIDTDTDELETRGYSFPILPIWVVYGVLLGSIANVSFLWIRIVLHIIYLFLILLFLKSAFSVADFQKSKETDNSLSSWTWKLNYLLFFIIIPFGVWVALMTMRGWMP